MQSLLNIFFAFLAGAMGGLANSLAVWFFGLAGISPALGFNMAPSLTLPWLLPRIISSGLWGLCFLFPFWREIIYLKGLLLSLGPAVLMLFVFFPRMGMGSMGMKLGASAPFFVLFFTMIWGLVTAFIFKRLRR